MATKYTVCGFGPSVSGLSTMGQMCYIADTQGAADTQRDAWITADVATAEAAYGVSNVRQVTSTDTTTKYIIVKRVRSTPFPGTATSLERTDEFEYAKYGTMAYTNP